MLVILWIVFTILYVVLYHSLFHVVYFGIDGMIKTVATAAALGLFTAYIILAFAIKHPIISIVLAMVAIGIFVSAKKSE